MKNLIIIEGVDGSGKRSTSEALVESIKGLHPEKSIELISFPRHGEDSGYLVDKYLNGELFKNSKKTSPLSKSLLYTVDRRIYYENNRELFENTDYIILDRSYLSNIVYHTLNMTKEEFFDFLKISVLTDSEILMNFWSREDIESGYAAKHTNAFMLVHRDIQVNLQLLRNEKKEKDIHELDETYLRNVSANISFISQNRIKEGLQNVWDTQTSVKDKTLLEKCYNWTVITIADEKFGDKLPSPLNIAGRILEVLDDITGEVSK